MMTIQRLIAFISTISLIVSAISEDDFHFDQLKHQPLQRLWGIPDVTAQIGQLFHYEIPKNAFYGNVARFKAYSDDGSLLPSWLTFMEKTGLMEGVPTEEDLGEHYIMVKAFDDDLHDFVKDIFALEVLSKADFHHEEMSDCRQEVDKIILSVILDVEYRKLTPLQRISLIKSFSNYFSIIPEVIHLSALEGNDKLLNRDVINAGPGNAKMIKYDTSTSMNFQIGCHGSLLKKYVHVLDNVSKTSRNGSLADILSKPVIGWKIWKEARNFYREKRELQVHNLISSDGSEDTEVVTPEPRSVIPNTVTPLYTPGPSPTITIPESTSRHHRHFHGMSHHHSPRHIQPTSTIPYESMATPTYIPDRPSSYTPEIDYERNVSPTLLYTFNTTTNTSTEQDSINEIRGTPDGLESYTSSSPTPPLINTSYPDDSTPYTFKNNPPTIVQLLQKFPITAGKVLRFKIPENTFRDPEDGNTRNLNLKLRLNATSDVPPDFWIQLNEKEQEIYALPLDNAISKWNFELVAYDSEGLFVQDTINIWVQDNKARRAVNHAITVELLTVPPGISLDWQLLVLDAICEKFGDSDPSNITVLNVTTKEPYSLTWTNDSLPRNECPLNEIQHLLKVLTDEDGLKNSEIHSGLKIGNISWTGIGLCESKPPELSNINYPPLARNPVDYLNATVGQLLVFSVPVDSFYDPEDGNTRSLKLSLETKDGDSIPINNWLQFDVKNQEFYGIPMSQDVGSKEYQLICRDKGGLIARDGLMVVVHPAPRVLYNVEFSMKLNLDYSQFVESPTLQRSFVEKLAQVFGDPSTNAIVLSGISPGSTVITWHNKSLPTNLCPDSTIKLLRQVILGDDERITDTVSRIMGDEFLVISARLTPSGLCQGALTEISSGGVEVPNNDVTAVSNTEHYIIGLIVPLVVITIMLLCAGIVACILYRRRRTGKMSVGDEDERQTFRSKGIPVIFQDELDERPEPTNKSPVIMKEEKPPLPPPEYQRGPPLATTALLSDTEDSPYQPPPPFTTSRDSARPKPTPTYRMPPPYVPP